ncbi:hypothetical protein IAU60_000090 [Kwoniella sp. DSM 27419]
MHSTSSARLPPLATRIGMTDTQPSALQSWELWARAAELPSLDRLSPVHAAILDHLAVIAPLELVRTSRALYDRYIPLIYRVLDIHADNCEAVFYGLHEDCSTPIWPSRTRKGESLRHVKVLRLHDVGAIQSLKQQGRPYLGTRIGDRSSRPAALFPAAEHIHYGRGAFNLGDGKSAASMDSLYSPNTYTCGPRNCPRLTSVCVAPIAYRPNWDARELDIVDDEEDGEEDGEEDSEEDDEEDLLEDDVEDGIKSIHIALQLACTMSLSAGAREFRFHIKTRYLCDSIWHVYPSSTQFVAQTTFDVEDGGSHLLYIVKVLDKWSESREWMYSPPTPSTFYVSGPTDDWGDEYLLRDQDTTAQRLYRVNETNACPCSGTPATRFALP